MATNAQPSGTVDSSSAPTMPASATSCTVAPSVTLSGCASATVGRSSGSPIAESSSTRRTWLVPTIVVSSTDAGTPSGVRASWRFASPAVTFSARTTCSAATVPRTAVRPAASRPAASAPWAEATQAASGGPA